MIAFPSDAPPGQRSAIVRLVRALTESHAARIGETTALSTQVHVQDVSRPDEVTALLGSDAGEVFYRRDRAGEILHVDVFHSPGQVDPKDAARGILSALSGLRFEQAPGCCQSMEMLLPYIDIQTALGGGRLDGELAYGQESGVRKAHLCHVHVTALLVPEVLASVFTIVAAVETAIEDAGLELRRIKRVRTAKGTSPVDISGYQTSTDSLLRQLPQRGTTTSTCQKEALARQVAKDLGSAEDTRRILEHISSGLRPGDFHRCKLSTDRTSEEVRQILSRSHLIKYDGQKYTLTGEGTLALSFLKEHSHEIEAYLRRVLWSLPKKGIPGGERKGHRAEPGGNRGRGPVLPRRTGEPLGDLALPETILSRGTRGTFEFSDLRFSYRKAKKGSPVVLLMDASASMAGRRIRAAKELARHMVLAGRDKVSVVAFQDAEVKVVCPFTKSPRKVEAGLGEIQAMGLTPLAMGLEKALEIASRSLKKPLVLCITDGIPTVPSTSLSPIEDSLVAARALAKRGVRLGCIGLEPNQSFLRQMVSAAKGTLYVVEELEASTLAAIAKRETAQ